VKENLRNEVEGKYRNIQKREKMRKSVKKKRETERIGMKQKAVI
jgi:hypothetical protein